MICYLSDEISATRNIRSMVVEHGDQAGAFFDRIPVLGVFKLTPLGKDPDPNATALLKRTL